jgi:class I fructose-bisphosphate aldolase
MMRRLGRIFGADGKTVVVAIDHGMGLPVNPALDDTGAVLRAVVKGGADAVLTTYGIAQRYQEELKGVGLILRMDGGGSCLSKKNECPSPLYTIEDALRLGADAVACMGFPGTDYEHENIENLAAFCAEGRAWGMPVIAETLPGGFSNDIPNTVDNLLLAARYGCEVGASVIKTAYAGTPEEYKRLIDACFAPVIVLGGEKTSGLSSLFECIEGALSVGAAGVAIGRNVWKHEDPERVTRALVQLVHGGAKASSISL